jgi:hypothetical protein
MGQTERSRRINDDRGDRRRQRVGLVAHSAGDERPRERVVERILSAHLAVPQMQGIGGIVALTTGAALIGLLSNEAVGSMSTPVIGLLGVTGGLAVGWMLWLITAPRIAAKRRRELVELRTCAACGADLREVDAEPDGCTVCPGCAAAWRLPGKDERPTVALFRRDDRGRRIRLGTGGRSRTSSPLTVVSIVLVDWIGRSVMLAALGTVVGVTIAQVLDLTLLGAGVIGATVIALLLGVPRVLGMVIRGKIKRRLVAGRLCPACAAQIPDSAPDGDGCTVCPGCSAAWRLG